MQVPGDIMSRYIERRRHELEECQGFLKELNFSELERVGHQLKGNGVTFGHPELSNIGIKLEAAAINQNESALTEVLRDFSKWVGSHP